MDNNINLDKFPVIIREKEGFVFPKGTKFEYEPFIAYRGIERKENDYTDVTELDFRSYAELGKKSRRIDTDDPSYFSVSLYTDRKGVENALCFPRKNRKIAKGKVCCEIGPILMKNRDGHVDWWLYDNVKVEGFIRCEEGE